MTQIKEFRAKHSSPIYYKSVAQRATVREDSRTIEFYFAVWGNKDLNGEVCVKGCFQKSIQEHGPQSSSPQKIICLYEHDLKLPLGKVLSISEDDYGAKAVVQFDNIQRCNDVLDQIKSGTIDQFSFGYKYVMEKTAYDRATKSIILNEVQLFEVTVTSIGVNEKTRMIGFKSLNIEDSIEELTNETELFIKSLDSTKQLQARSIIYKHIALSKEADSIESLLNAEPPAVDIAKAINNFTF
jgi:uncharacterized protein